MNVVRHLRECLDQILEDFGVECFQIFKDHNKFCRLVSSVYEENVLDDKLS